MKRAKVKKNTMFENYILLHFIFFKKVIEGQCCLSHIYCIRRGGVEKGGRGKGMWEGKGREDFVMGVEGSKL